MKNILEQLEERSEGGGEPQSLQCQLQREWDHTMRERSKLSVAIFDVDHFKGFNDHCGHQVGDDCLRATATAIKSAARDGRDVGARYRGGEIVAILCDLGPAKVQKFAEDALNTARELGIPHAKNDDKQRVTVSVEVATRARASRWYDVHARRIADVRRLRALQSRSSRTGSR